MEYAGIVNKHEIAMSAARCTNEDSLLDTRNDCHNSIFALVVLNNICNRSIPILHLWQCGLLLKLPEFETMPQELGN